MKKSHKLITTFMISLALLASAGELASAEKYSRRTPVVEAVEKVLPSVVNISTSKTIRELVRVNPFGSPFRTPFDRVYQKDYDIKGLGSGVLVEGGYVITNNHVLESQYGRPDQILITFHRDNTQYEASVVGYDPSSDVAVLKVNEEIKRSGLSWGRTDDLMIGETVIAIGNALGQPFTVTNGIISALNRTISANDDIRLSNLIQTNADINRGSSGGPLVNINGEFIGLNTAILSPSGGSIGLGFAIPVSRVKKIYDYWVNDIISLEDQLGISTQTLNTPFQQYFLSEYPNLNKNQLKGTVVVEEPKSQLAQDKLQKGDVINAVNGKEILDSDDFINRLDEHRSDILRLGIIRDGQPKNVVIETPDQEVETMQWAGMEVQTLDDPWKRRFYLPQDENGLIVRSIQPGSSAAKEGLQRGDWIYAINQKNVANLEDFRNIFQESINARSIQINYLRNTEEGWKRSSANLNVVPTL